MSKVPVNDFGFFFEDDTSAILQDATATKESAVLAATTMYQKINGLLKQLESNPEKPTINWPGRVDHVKKFRASLISILDEAGITVS